MRIAVQGCCHGSLDAIYHGIKATESKDGVKVDLLVVCGDFEAIRNIADLQNVNTPAKYRKMKDFKDYYSGEKLAPIPTIFIGGNHEACNYLWELYYGGWVCPNIYFLGYSGVVTFGGLRIAGLSGIYSTKYYKMGHYEQTPYKLKEKCSAYLTKKYETFKLLQLRQPVDLFISHDWPRGIEKYGNVEDLLKRKPFFQPEIEKNTLGSPASESLLSTIQPKRWCSGHMHVHFEAIVAHNTKKINDDDDAKCTLFTGLDKCVPDQQYLKIIDYSDEELTSTGKNIEKVLCFDPEWLAITKALQPWFSRLRIQPDFPNTEETTMLIEQAQLWVKENIKDFRVDRTQQFCQTAPTANDTIWENIDPKSPEFIQFQCAKINEQTENICQLLNISNLIIESENN